MGVAVSWFVPGDYRCNTFHSNVPSLGCIDNQTLWTTDGLLNCKSTQQGNNREPWVLQNFSKKKKCLSWISLNKPRLIPAGVCVCVSMGQALSVADGKPRSAPCRHTQAAAAEPCAVIKKNISHISGHCVLSYPRASFLRPEKFTGWLRGMCTLLGKKKSSDTSL